MLLTKKFKTGLNSSKTRFIAMGKMLTQYPKNLRVYIKSCMSTKSIGELCVASAVSVVSAVYAHEFLMLGCVVVLTAPINDPILKFITGIVAFGAVEVASYVVMELVAIIGSIEVLRFIGSINSTYKNYLKEVKEELCIQNA